MRRNRAGTLAILSLSRLVLDSATSGWARSAVSMSSLTSKIGGISTTGVPAIAALSSLTAPCSVSAISPAHLVLAM